MSTDRTRSSDPELVVLVDDRNEPVGTAEKSTVHGPDTPLHRGFSVFLFDSAGRVLLQQRSRSKRTWPLVWSNSCCGHPGHGESNEEAGRRRLSHELGLHGVLLTEIFPDYRYTAERDGVVENEFCSVMIGRSDGVPAPRPSEVEAVRWMDWQDFVLRTRRHPGEFSEWCVEETAMLDADPRFSAFYRSVDGVAA